MPLRPRTLGKMRKIPSVKWCLKYDHSLAINVVLYCLKKTIQLCSWNIHKNAEYSIRLCAVFQFDQEQICPETQGLKNHPTTYYHPICFLAVDFYSATSLRVIHGLNPRMTTSFYSQIYKASMHVNACFQTTVIASCSTECYSELPLCNFTQTRI